MNFKIAGLLFVIGFMTIENVNCGTIKYSDIVTQLIEAATLDDAKIILNAYDNTIDQNILREHLLTRQNLWFAKHGLYDCMKKKYEINEAGRYAGKVIGAGCFGFSAFIFYIYSKYNLDSKEGFGISWTSAIIGMIFLGTSLSGVNENIILKPYIDEFKRIKELLACVG